MSAREVAALVARGALLVVLLVFVAMAMNANESPLKLGEPAPAAHLHSYDGREWGLERFAGRPVLLSFWGTWCGPCLAEMPTLVAFAEAEAENVVLVAAAVDSPPEEVFEVIRRFQIRFPVAAADRGTIQRYHATAVPLAYLLDAQHRVVWSARGVSSRSELDDAVRALRPGDEGGHNAPVRSP